MAPTSSVNMDITTIIDSKTRMAIKVSLPTETVLMVNRL